MLKKRLIAWLLMFALCFYSMPVYAFAQEASDAAGDDTSISENVDATPSDTEASDSETSGAEASDDVTDESDNAETGAPDSEDSDTDEGATEGTDDNGQTAPDEGNAGEDESVGVTPDEGENTDEVIGDENNNSEPAEPADPEQSAGPETLEPTEPEQPAEPTEPADPTEPEQPAEPTEPEMPETPAEPEQSTEPVTPEEPTEPEQPTQPVEPQKPVVTPEEPVVPEEPKDIPIEQVPVLPEVNQVVDALQNVAPPVVEVPVVPEISAEVQAFLAAVAELPDTVTKENLADVAALLENVLPLFTQLTEEEQESEEVAAAYMLVLALWEQCEGVKAALLETLEWTYIVEEPMTTSADDLVKDGYLYRESVENIADEQLMTLLSDYYTHYAAPYGIYADETYVIPATGSTGLETRMAASGFIGFSLSDTGTHKLYITDNAAQHMIPSWDVEKAEDGSAIVNGIKIQGIKGGSVTQNLFYVHYPIDSEEPDIVYCWKVFIAPSADSFVPSNDIPAAPGDSEAYFWYGTEKPAYERVFANDSVDRDAASMVMVPMKEDSYHWNPDSTTWTADGEHNYNVVYCAEMGVVTNPAGERYRIAKVIEESKFNKATQDALRAIIENGYPFLSADEMNQRMGKNYDTAVLTAGTQYAVWAITDGITDDVTDLATSMRMAIPFINDSHIYIPYNGSNYKILSPKDTLYGKTPIYSKDVTPASERAAAAKAVNEVANYLLDCEASELQQEFKIVTAVDVFSKNDDGTYNVTINGTLSREAESVDGDLETIKVTLSDGVNTIDSTVDGTSFTVTLENVAAGAVVTLKAEASLPDRMQVYYYTSETGDYQNFIGGSVGHSSEQDSKEFTAPEDPKTTSMTVSKVWSDGMENHVDDEISVNVLAADGSIFATVILNADNNWFTKLDGLTIGEKYTVEEVKVAGYTSTVKYDEEGNAIITNIKNDIPKPETISVSIVKVWFGDTEADRPEQVVFKLLVDGEATRNIVLNADNHWKATIDGLNADHEYSVEEVSVVGYTSGSPVITEDGKNYIFTIINTKVKEPEKLSVRVVKLWENDTEAERPEQVIFKLLVDGVATQDIILNAANNWQATVTELEAGHEYSVEEVAVDGYVSSTPEQTGDAKNLIFTVTNTKIKTETVDLKFVKLWENDNEANRPAQVVFKLLVDGVATQDIILNVANSWQATLTGLEADHEYAVEEVAVDGYTSSEPVRTVEDGTIVFTVTNTRTVTPPPNTPNDPGDDNPGGDDDPELPPVPTTNIEEPPVPLTETPTEEVIFDEEVPLTGMPEEDEEILLDEEVPLAKVPKTGDNLILWFFAAVASAIGALGLGRKRD